MERAMKRDELIERVAGARAAWEALLDTETDARFAEPGVAGEWSLKDVVAHIAWFEREMIGVIRAKALVGSDLWQLPPHERNDAIFRENRDRRLSEVRAEADRTYAELVEVLPTLSDEDLANAASFPGMPPDWVPFEIIAQNTYEHYEAHAEGLRRWRAAKRQDR
jgi:hypothetical protein